MNYRGRLIWPSQARISRLNTAATAANTLGQPSGYDRITREPVRTTAGADSRVYFPPVALPCQVQPKMGQYDELRQYPAGRELEFKMHILLHYPDLEMAGLLKPNGSSIFQPSDRLDAIYRADGVTLLRSFEDNPLFCVHVQDRSFGLDGLNRNLVLLYFNDRVEGAA